MTSSGAKTRIAAMAVLDKITTFNFVFFVLALLADSG